jgi:hypothetical protein
VRAALAGLLALACAAAIAQQDALAADEALVLREDMSGLWEELVAPAEAPRS